MVASGGKDRVLEAAYDLFTHRGTAQVGVDAVVARAGTAKMTLYRHFGSREALALAVLRERELRWTRGWLDAETARRSPLPHRRLLVIFDMFEEWFARADFEGCLFLKGVLEYEAREHPVRSASVEHLGSIRALLGELAAAAGAPDPVVFARQWHVLMMGSIMAAEAGDLAAADAARRLGSLLLREHGLPDC